MTAFAELAVGVNISGFAVSINTQFEAVRSLERGSVAPTIKPVGLLWNNTANGTYGETIERWNGTTWDVVLDLGAPAISASGSISMAADLDLGGFKIENGAAGTAGTDFVIKSQVMLRDGSQAMTAALPMGGFKITGLANGTDPTDAAALGQVTPGRTGVFQYEDDCQIVQAADPDNTWEPVEGVAAQGGYFCPRMLILRFRTGFNFTDQDDADVTGTVSAPVEFTWYRWTDGPGHDDYVELGQLSVGVQMVRVEVKAKRTGAGSLGFFLRLRRVDNDVLQNYAGVQYMAWSGVNQ